jgi:hypothetical protein
MVQAQRIQTLVENETCGCVCVCLKEEYQDNAMIQNIFLEHAAMNKMKIVNNFAYFLLDVLHHSLSTQSAENLSYYLLISLRKRKTFSSNLKSNLRVKEIKVKISLKAPIIFALKCNF